MSTNESRQPRVFFYVQHLLGIGHLARASRVAAALVEGGFAVTLVTGGLPVKGFPGPGIEHIELPPVATGVEFAGLAQADGTPVDKVFEEARTRLLLDAFHRVKPDVVITEAFPFGRRQVRFELLPLLDAIAATEPRPIVCASVRDILQENRKPGRDQETVDLVQNHFDHVLVHGDPAFARIEDTFPLADRISERVIYTGMVAPPAPNPSPERYDIVVSAGGGVVGAALMEAAVAASADFDAALKWCVITGPNLPQADFDRLAVGTPDNISLFRFRPDFPNLLAAATLSISQAGYNTVGDLLQTSCRLLLVPFATGGETEQTERAEKLKAMGLAAVVEEASLSKESMSAAITEALKLPPPSTVDIRMDGAKETGRILRGLLAERVN
ncbi:glycosyltransferase [Neorhizobium sp. JUb45]|uniref:glycosyltransferase family protein n=1 Tax=unclassified Neorhizobium TaxID=2629175 RepID=UPI00104DA95F|nr:glycosyltransferase [Neorhizobium sp. JUb45]TCQ99754.1 putative glycosyltransferase [Neorhizobium sp. JUb45]